MATGAKTSTAAADHQTPINCRTCHNVHETYGAADMALTSETPVTLWMGDQIGVEMTVDIGKGNLCANCHQPRARDEDTYYGELFGTGTEMAITSSRFGPHHGPQSTMLTMQGGYEYDGVTYTSSSHRNAEDGCVTCHMAEPAYADEASGHTWSPKRDNGEIWVVGCGATGCHDVSTDDLEDVLRDEAEVEQSLIWDDVNDDGVLDSTGDTGLLVDLKAKLIQIAMLTESDRSVTSETTMWPLDLAGAVWNFQLVREDHSHGLHNFKYATKLLESSITAVDAYIATLP